ncbi:TonB-dependent receptor plug domain protein [Bacteroides pyogenes F0041]|uniref:TonB-dependent receptor plug domain protein n=1 Tax=Bacteroides pyogenes F0041 TaxID=1321819 RepID=U2CMM1_9BACE|nr:TonB-dependent receptor [Bacteroides pyogenes]ERI85308.1 TonB-dependent receptor plug domain protein [Bacteroides pyogenes F0041]
MLQKTVWAFSLAFVCCVASAQVTVKGRVLDAETGEPLAGVNVRADHSLKGGTTNAKGEFTVKDLPAGKQTLRITHVGYEPLRYSTSRSAANVVLRMTESHNNLGQVVVTGTGTHRRMADSPIPVNVITAKDIRDANIGTLEEALTKLTSSFSFSTSGMGTEMLINGLNSNYILILVNGRKMIGDDALMRVDMANVKRIEILNGSASALYGSDAIGGVVNIITDDSRNSVDASSTTRVSNHGRFTESVNLDVNAGKFSSYTSYRRQQSEGWQLNPMAETVNKKTKETELKPTDKQAFTGFYANTMSQHFSFAPNNRTTLYAQGSYYNFLTKRPVSEYKYNLYHTNYTYGFGMKYMVNKRAYIDADFYSDNYKSSYDYIKEDKEFKVGDKETRKEVTLYRGNIKSIVKLNEWNKLSAGLEYLDEKLTSESDKVSDKTLYTLALYAQDEWKITKGLEAVIGMRYIYNETFGDHFTPTASLMYKEGAFRTRFSFATGFRTPALSQIYGTNYSKKENRYTIGNLELDPEESKNFTLNMEYTKAWFSASLTGYLNNVKNMLWYLPISDEEAAKYGTFDAPVQQRANLHKVRVKGANVNVNAYLGLGFNVGAGYSLIDGKNLITGKRLDKSIKYAGNVNAQWAKNWGLYGLNINMVGRGQGQRYSETYDYHSSGFMLWDLNTGHTFNLKYLILNAGLGVENLFDWRDDRPWNSSKPYATVTPGRAFYASLTVRFRK